MKTAAVLECPSLIGIVPPDSITNLSCAYAGNGSVGVNYAIAASGAPANLYIESPQNTVAFAEAIGFSHATASPTLVRYGGYMVSPSNNNSSYGGRPSFHGRHLKKGNVLWYDGHVTSEIPFIQTLGLDTTYGWAAAPCVQFNIGQITPVPPGSSQVTYLTALNKDFYFWADKTNQK
jgi:prepilin-type processing-associated H-X9-DG protein